MKIVVEGTTLSTLTLSEEDQLRNLAKASRELDNDTLIETIKWNADQSNSRSLLSFPTCSNCEKDVVRVRRTWLIGLFRNKIIGYYCENSQCHYYFKLDPEKKSYELLSFKHTPKINLILKDGGVAT